MTQNPNKSPARQPATPPEKQYQPTRCYPGPTNSFADVKGIRIAHADDKKIKTGVSVILPDKAIAMGVDVRGGGPGTRETNALDADCLVDRVHALVLAGGSVFGLAAADKVAERLSAAHIGLDLGVRFVPVVPSAILFDLRNGGDKQWGDQEPYRRLGDQAVGRLLENHETCDATLTGPVGAGFGATAGARQGGIGTASFTTADGLVVAALIAVNSFGSVTGLPDQPDAPLGVIDTPKMGLLAANTTIGAIATNAVLDKAGCRRTAIMAQDGLARAIRPLHTPYDGDTLFAMASGEYSSSLPLPALITLIGSLAADAAEMAVRRAVLTD